MKELKGPAPSALDGVEAPSREVAEAQAREWNAHAAAEPGFGKAADVLSRDTLQGLRSTKPHAGQAPALQVIKEHPAPDLPVDEPEAEAIAQPAEPSEPVAPVPVAPVPAAPVPAAPVPAGARSTMERDPDASLAAPSVRLPQNLASPSHRARNVAIAVSALVAIGLLVLFVGSSGADESDAKHQDTTQLSPSLPGTTLTVTAIATATAVPASATLEPTSTAAVTSEQVATSRRSASAKSSVQTTSEAPGPSGTTAVKTVPSPPTSAPPSSTLPWIKPQNQ